MATGVHIQEPVLDTLRRGDENEMDQAINITLGKIPVEGNVGDSHTPIEPPETFETDFEVKDSVKGNEGSASTIEGENFLKSPSAAEVHFEENNLGPDASQVTENAEKMATEHKTDALHVGEAKLNAEESNGLEKGLVTALKVPATSEVGHDKSIPVHEAGLSENKEDSESTLPEKEAAHKESLKVNPQDTKTCVAVSDTETTSSVEEKSMSSSTSQDIPGEKNEQTAFDMNKESPVNISKFVPNEETKQNLSIELDDSRMKNEENLEKEDEKPESTLIPVEKIKNGESTQNELFESKNETETGIQKSEEVSENGVESSPVAAREAEDIEASTSDHDTRASALEYQILTENPQEIKVDKSECKPEKETPEEQVITETTARDASHDETTPVDKAKTEDEEPNKSDFIETEEDAESTILVEEPILEKHLESLNAIHDDIKACDLVQDTETKSSIKEKLPTATPQEIWGDKIEQTSFDPKEETPEDISTNVSNEETEQNSIVEVPFVTGALTTDNETEGNIKDEDQREKDLLENNNDTENEMLKQEVTEKPVESVQLANVAEDTQASTLDHDTEISDIENQILTENPQEIVADETENKPCDVVDTKKKTLDVQDVSIIESNDDNEENLVIKEDESEKPFSREESTRDAASDESTYTHEDKNEGDDQRRAELFENPNSAEILSSIEDNTIPKLVESPQVDAEDIKTRVLDQDAETTGLISASEGKSNDGEYAVKYEVKTEDDDQKEDQLCDNEKNPETNVLLEAAKIETPIESLQETLPSTVPRGFLDDKTEEKTVDAIQKDKEILDNISTIVPNEETEQNLSIELDDSHMITDENLEKEDEKPESTLIPEGKIKNEESTQNEFFETKNETETVIQKMEEVIEKGVESLPAAASEAEAEDIEASTSDHVTETRALENQILTENPQGIEVDKSEHKPEKETPEEQVSKSASMTSEDASATKHEAHLDKESEKPCFTDASMRDPSNDETMPIDKAVKEDEEPSKYNLFENKEVTTESTIPDAADTKDTPEAPDVSTFVLNDDDEENLVIGEDDSEMKNEDNLGKESENPSSIEASPMDTSSDESTKKFEDKIEGKEQTRVEDTECTLLKEAETAARPLESPQVDAEDIKTYVSDQGTETTGLVEVFEEVVNDIKTYVSDEGAETTGMVEAFGGDANDDKSAIKYEVKTEDDDQKDSEKNPESGVLLEAAQIEKPIESLQETLTSKVPREFLDDKTEEKKMDAIEKDKETLDTQSVAKTVSNEKIEDKSLIQADGSQIQHEECLEKEIEIMSVIEASTKHANDDELISIHEDNIEHKDLRKAELLESNRDTKINLQKEEAQMETSFISLLVAAEDVIASDSYHGAETTSHEEQFLNESEIIHEKTEVERLDTADSAKEIPEAQNFAIILSSENIKENSWIPEDGSEQKNEEFLEKESKARPFSETSTMEVNDEVPEAIHQDKIEDEKLEKVDKFECDKHEEITLLNEAPAEKLNEPSKEDLEDIKDIVSGSNTIERSLIEVQSLNENQREIVGDHMDENIVDKDPEEIEDEHLDKDVMLENEKHREIGFIKEEELVKKLQEPEKKDLEEIRAFVSHESTETSSIEERDLTKISEESVGDLSQDKILDKAQEIQDFTTIVSGEDTEKNSSIQPDGLQMKHEEPSEKECEMLSTPETSFLYSSNDEVMTVDVENIENDHLKKVDKFEEEKHAEISLIKEEAPLEKLNELSLRKDLEEIGEFDLSEDTETSSTGERNLTAIPQKNDFTTVDASQIKHEEPLERESEPPPLALFHSSDGKSAIVDMGKIEDEVLEKADKFEGIESGEATLLNEEAPAEKLTESSKDLEGNKESITSDGTEITSSTEEQNLTKISQEIVDDQEEKKILNVAGEASDFTTIIPDNNNTERNLLVEVDASQMKHEEHLEEEREIPSLLTLNTSTEEPTIVQENKIMEHAEVILSNEEALENSSKEENENIKASVLCEDTETSSIEQESLMANSHEIVGDQVKEKIIDIAQNAPDLTTITSDENSEENSLIQLDGSQTKHEEPLERENETPSMPMLDTTIEESTIFQGRITDDQDPRKIDEFEREKDTEATLLKESTSVEKVTESMKDDLEDTKVFPSCEDKEITSSIVEQSQKDNQQEIVVDQTQDNILDSAAEAQDYKGIVSHENAGENLLIQVDESEVKNGIVSDQTQENALDTVSKDQDLKPAISHENAEENSLIQVDEIQMKHDELEKKSETTPSLLIVDTSNEESKTIYENITEDENQNKIHDFECEKHEEITSTEEEAHATKVNESSKEDLEDIKALVSGEDSETTSFEEKQSLKENTRENLTKDKILGVVPEALESKIIVSDKNNEENSFILEDGSQMKQGEHSEKEIEMPSVSENSILNARSEEPTLFLDDKIEEEDQAKGNKSECEKYAEITEVSVENPNSSNLENIEAFVSCEDIEPTNSTEEQSLTVNPIENVGGQEVEKVLDKALVAPDFTPVVPDDNNDDNKLIQVDGSQMKHEEPLEKESEIPSSLETSLLNTNNEETENIHKDLTEDDALENVDEFESKKCSEINKLKEEAQVEESAVYKDIKAYVSYQDTEASALQEQILAANPQDILGNQSEDNVIDTANSKEKITEQNLPVSNENVVKDSLIQIDESETKYEEISEKEPYMGKTSTVEANNESTTSHEDMIEEESGEITESALLNEGSSAYESVESLQVVSEDIKASVSSQKMDTKSSSLNADQQEIAGDQTDDKINTAGTRELTLEALNLTTLDSNENKVLDSITPHDGLEIEDEEISMLADNKESIIVHEDTIEGKNLKKVDTFESAQQTEDTLSKEEAHEDESMDSLHVASEPIKASVSYQDRDPTSSSEEQILTTTPQIVGDQVEEKLTYTAKTWEETPEVSSSVLEFREDEANRIGVDDINSVMIKDEETANRSNATENDEICSSDKVQAKEEEMEIISKMKIDEEADKDDTWIKLTDDETNKSSIEEKEIDFSSHDKDTSEITQHDGAEDIPKGNENFTSKNEFLEDGYSNGSTESTTPIVNEDAEKIDKDIKAETDITETGAASSALPVTGVQCGPEEIESEDSKVKETETSLASEGREYLGQHTKLHESPSPPLSHVKDSEWEMAQKRGRDNLQSGDDTKESDEGSVAISNEGNLNKNIETEVTAGEKEVSAIQQDLVSEFAVHEIQEQQGKTVEAVAEEKGIKSEQGEIKFDDSDDLKINSSTMVTDKVAPSDILCSSTSDAGQRAVDQETQIIVQEKEHKPGKGTAVEAVPEERGINTEEDEIKEHDFDVLKENSPPVALDKVTPVNILQGSTTDAALRATDEETPEQYGLDEASLKEIEGGPASTTDKLTVLRTDQINNENFDSSLGSNKIPVLQHGDSSESSQTEGEKQKTSESEKEEKCRNAETAKLMETSESTEMDKPSLSGLLQEPIKEVLKVVDLSIDKKESTTKEEEMQEEKSAEVEHVEAKTDEEKDGEEESGEHQISDLSSDAPVMVDAADKDVKVAHKKSHNMLSGVGSKVKHSISKVKKAITGKSSHPKSASPKFK